MCPSGPLSKRGRAAMIEKLMKAALAGNPELVHKYDHEVIATSLEVYAESFDAA